MTFPVLRVIVLGHDKAFFGRNRFDAIHSRYLLALVLLCHSSHSQQSRGFRFHQQLLQFLYFSRITTLFGSIDALLNAEAMLFELAPGQLVPSHAHLVSFLRR